MQYQNMKKSVNTGLKRAILCMNNLDLMVLNTNQEQIETNNWYDNMLINLINMGAQGLLSFRKMGPSSIFCGKATNPHTRIIPVII